LSQTHRGSCHCGLVTFEVDADITGVVDCNCSLCRRKGALWVAAAENDLRILSGEKDLVLYQFNTKTAKHYSCPRCGISPFSHPRLAPGKWVVNARCIDGLDLAKLPVRTFDGVHWEEAAQQFLAELKRRAPG
jgi:hypothetical protein